MNKNKGMKQGDEQDLQRLIIQGMAGDNEAKRLAVTLYRTQNEMEMNPLCIEWMHSFASAGDKEMRLYYVQEVMFRPDCSVDLLELEHWIRQIAAEDPATGYYLLALLYDEDIGQLPDEEKAEANMKLAAAAGNNRAMLYLADYYLIMEDYETHSLQEIRELAEKVAQDCSIEGRFRLLIDVCMEMGDYQSVVRYLKQWAKDEPKNAVIPLRLGLRYINGEGVKENAEQALKYFEKAAYLGDESAMYIVADMNATGKGCRRNMRRAMDYYTRAAQAEHSPSCVELAKLYCAGVHIQKNVELGIQYYEKAVKYGNAEACLRLALMYYEGVEVEQDHEKAAVLMDTARKYLNSCEDENAEELLQRVEELAMENHWPTTHALFELVTPQEMKEAIDTNDFRRVIHRVYKSLLRVPMGKDVLRNAWYLMQIKVIEEEELSNYLEILRCLADEYPKVALMVGDMYYEGVGAKRNARSAMLFYRKALETPLSEQAYLRIILGLHEEVLVGRRDKVPEWLEAARRDCPDSVYLCYMLALLYHVGLYVEKDAEAEAAMLQRAKELGLQRNMEDDLKHWQVGRDCLRDLLDLPESYSL